MKGYLARWAEGEELVGAPICGNSPSGHTAESPTGAPLLSTRRVDRDKAAVQVQSNCVPVSHDFPSSNNPTSEIARLLAVAFARWARARRGSDSLPQSSGNEVLANSGQESVHGVDL